MMFNFSFLMASTLKIPKAQFILALILPLAVILGYLLVDPLEPSSVLVVGLVLGSLVLPLAMRWYHPLLIFVWNATIAPAFLPGTPHLWLLVTLAGFVIAIMNRSVNANYRFLSAPGITYSLLFFTAVIVVTAYLNGGIGTFALGSSKYGGRRYFYTVFAILGYFVLTSQRVPAQRAMLFTCLFFLSALTALVPEALGFMGSTSNLLYAFFPPDFTTIQAVTGEMFESDLSRIFGLTACSTAIFCALMAKYGIRGTFELRKPWRGCLFLLAGVAAFYSGFRSNLIFILLLFAIQFYVEGLHRTRFLAATIAVFAIGGGLILTQADRLPLVVQRTISFLPIQVSPIARLSADSSLEWRLQMWNEVLPDVPKHLLLGKGYSIDPTELYFSASSGNSEFHWAVVTGDYHSGPLSLVMPFGIWGVIAFAWFCAASIRCLYQNLRFGRPELHSINTFLFACFLAKLVFFLAFFGGFWSDFSFFTGLIGLSLSLNGIPVPKPKTAPSGIEERSLVETVFRDDYA